MSEKSLSNSKEYLNWLSAVKARYHQQQIKAAIHVNRALLEFYWELGRDIVERKFENVYGSVFFSKLSIDLKENPGKYAEEA